MYPKVRPALTLTPRIVLKIRETTMRIIITKVITRLLSLELAEDKDLALALFHLAI